MRFIEIAPELIGEQPSEITKWWHEKKGWCEFCDPVFGNGGWA